MVFKETIMTVITPTPGRMVWVRNADGIFQTLGNDPLAATITAVHHDRMVNLTIFDANGSPNSCTSVPLRQPEDPAPEGLYCEWMPFQISQQRQLDGKDAGG